MTVSGAGGCNSVVKHLPSVQRALGSILSTAIIYENNDGTIEPEVTQRIL